MSQETAKPGAGWLEIILRPTLEMFAAAFTDTVELESSVGRSSIVGVVNLRHFFDATREMYEAIGFVHETSSGSRTVLEWEGRYRGAPIAGATILTRNADGAIEHIDLYHRPFDQLVAFSAELAIRMEQLAFAKAHK